WPGAHHQGCLRPLRRATFPFARPTARLRVGSQERPGPASRPCPSTLAASAPVSAIRLKEMGESVTPINFGSPPFEPLDDQGRPYGGPLNRRAEMWLKSKEWLESVEASASRQR